MDCSVVFEIFDNTHVSSVRLSIWNITVDSAHGSTDRCISTLSVLTPKQVEVVGVEQLEAEEGKNDLKRERATINKVTIEQLNSVVKHYDAQFLDLRGVMSFKTKW